jgi:glucan-binding YG repeat protein
MFTGESKKMITADTYKIGGYVRQFNPDHSVKPIEGWQVKGGKTYYYENGSRVTGFKKIDGYTYYFKKSDDAYGEMASGWISIGGDVYYFFRYGTEKYGRMVTGRQTISSSVYYFNSDGTINTGFVGDSNGNVHYYHYSEMLKGWYEIGGNIYYFTKENGNMATGEKTIGGVKYVFTNKGILLLPSYEGATVIGGSTQNGNGFDISDGDWSDIIII